MWPQGLQSSFQPRNTRPDLSRIDSGKSKHNTAFSCAPPCIAPQRNYFDVVLGGSCCRCFRSDASLQPSDRLQPCFNTRNLQKLG